MGHAKTAPPSHLLDGWYTLLDAARLLVISTSTASTKATASNEGRAYGTRTDLSPLLGQPNDCFSPTTWTYF